MRTTRFSPRGPCRAEPRWRLLPAAFHLPLSPLGAAGRSSLPLSPCGRERAPRGGFVRARPLALIREAAAIGGRVAAVTAPPAAAFVGARRGPRRAAIVAAGRPATPQRPAGPGFTSGRWERLVCVCWAVGVLGVGSVSGVPCVIRAVCHASLISELTLKRTPPRQALLRAACRRCGMELLPLVHAMSCCVFGCAGICEGPFPELCGGWIWPKPIKILSKTSTYIKPRPFPLVRL